MFTGYLHSLTNVEIPAEYFGYEVLTDLLKFLLQNLVMSCNYFSPVCLAFKFIDSYVFFAQLKF